MGNVADHIAAGVPGTAGSVNDKLAAFFVTPYGIIANTQTGNYTLVMADAGRVVEMNVASANTLTVPPNSSVAFPIGTIVEVHQYGLGQTIITPGSGVTLRSNGAKLKTAAQYATASLRKRAENEWVVSGDLVA